jgi:myo-inositol-hexaphosphate 3-phosphohydrolase
MYEETTIVTPHGAVESSAGHDPLEGVIAEIGATYPLMAYTAQAGESDEAEAMNAAILAGMVSP